MPDRSDIAIQTRAIETPEPSAKEADEIVARRAEAEEDIDLVEHVRERLDLDEQVSDVTIAASLAQIAARGDLRGRWLAAFGSPLGKHLARRGTDLDAGLNTLLALAPRQLS
ncbi:MAG: hypothetical protein SFW09_04920 [Hyphomicrobiaceae bacterium]|nr:hypothetical protein [Hyphomicrobiaceae bacterium]